MEEYIIDTTEYAESFDSSSDKLISSGFCEPSCQPYACHPCDYCYPKDDPGGCFPDICTPGPDY